MAKKKSKIKKKSARKYDDDETLELSSHLKTKKVKLDGVAHMMVEMDGNMRSAYMNTMKDKFSEGTGDDFHITDPGGVSHLLLAHTLWRCDSQGNPARPLTLEEVSGLPASTLETLDDWATDMNGMISDEEEDGTEKK